MMVVEYNNFTIIRKTQGGVPSLPFVDIKEALLGIQYDLSLVFPTHDESVALHKTWKKKDGPVNTLAFPLDDDSGEIIITLKAARQEAKKYGRTYHQHLIFLFIHSCLHLKGMTHGAKMEQHERRWYAHFTQ